ncbi:MAG TPA: hypothetical protein VFI03_00050 [Solirubrobacterales bacterium]|nr:hypothetical protein [Solirubrobacterales bacterium]
MKRLLSALMLAAALALCAAAPAGAAFGLEEFDVAVTNEDGSPATEAGTHPFQMRTSVFFNRLSPSVPDGEFKDGAFEQIVGLVATPTVVPQCETVDFLTALPGRNSQCPDATAVGYASSELDLITSYAPVYNLAPSPGMIAKLGFVAANTPVTIEVGLKHSYPYNGLAAVVNLPQTAGALASVVTLWGHPADPVHDPFRGNCVSNVQPEGAVQVIAPDFPEPPSYGDCPTSPSEVPFLTLPRACQGPLGTNYAIASWQNPGARLPNGEPNLADPAWVTGSALSQISITECAKLGFSPSIVAQPTSNSAESPSGLDFGLNVDDQGLTSALGRADSDIKKAVVTLPEGMSTNPSAAAGLDACSEAQLAAETPDSLPGQGCPQASKIGTVEVETPLLEQTIHGSIYVATPFANPVGSQLALYMVLQDPGLGIVVKQAIKVEPDPVTGRLTTVTENIPQLPFSHFTLRFREGARAPLTTPPGCGSYAAEAVLTPWAGGVPITTSSAFTIATGPAGGPCPSGIPPFKPGLTAGTINNAAAHYSPFYLRLTRNDGEGELTGFSVKLPPGLIGKLAGVSFCPEAAIAAARSRTGPEGGAEELATPSCPAGSEIGRTLAGAGVGPALTYVPGKVYLAGPYNGAALSIVAITAAKVGPFDLGTVVIRQALRVDPDSAEVTLDPAASDPLPHIIDGIPVHLRDVRAYVDRPNFTLNPTGCKPSITVATLFGSGLDSLSPADDATATATAPFQAADCAALPFKPKLQIRLKGGIKRGSFPALRAEVTYPKAPYANIARAQVALPHSEFLAQEHIRTICTRVQFAQGSVPGQNCPAGAIYGRARAITPLLDEPLEGPVFLRSSSNPLPDLVVALRSPKVNVNVVGRIDSIGDGRIRTTFTTVPDAPVARFVLEMQGGKKGLLVNSTNICRGKHLATANFTGHNGKAVRITPAVKAKCGKGKRGS